MPCAAVLHPSFHVLSRNPMHWLVLSSFYRWGTGLRDQRTCLNAQKPSRAGPAPAAGPAPTECCTPDS